MLFTRYILNPGAFYEIRNTINDSLEEFWTRLTNEDMILNRSNNSYILSVPQQAGSFIIKRYFGI